MVYLKSPKGGAPYGKYLRKATGRRPPNRPPPRSHHRRIIPAAGNGELSIDDRFANRLAFNNASTSRLGLDELLKANEQAAHHAFKTTLRSIPAPKLSASFSRNLEKTVIPRLEQIGLDAELAVDLFCIGGPSWQLMAPYLHQKIVFHPKMLHDIKTIREGIIRKAGEPSENMMLTEAPSTSENRLNINRGMAPENLQGLFGRIATSWIILPRAYNDLRENQCRYLPAYLLSIKRNGHLECNRIFMRIVIELVANFSTKFADHRYSPVTLKNAVFHAYEAMFWRSLRRPPPGHEDCRVFEILLNFLIRHAGKWPSISPPMAKAILRMQIAKAHIFPQSVHPDTQLEPSCFLVTLRHGIPEMQALLRYFESILNLNRNAEGRQQNNMMLLKATSALIYEVGRKYRQENHRTQQNVRQFFDRLRCLYSDKSHRKAAPAMDAADPICFSTHRIVRMIDGFNRNISCIF